MHQFRIIKIFHIYIYIYKTRENGRQRFDKPKKSALWCNMQILIKKMQTKQSALWCNMKEKMLG